MCILGAFFRAGLEISMAPRKKPRRINHEELTADALNDDCLKIVLKWLCFSDLTKASLVNCQFRSCALTCISEKSLSFVVSGVGCQCKEPFPTRKLVNEYRLESIPVTNPLALKQNEFILAAVRDIRLMRTFCWLERTVDCSALREVLCQFPNVSGIRWENCLSLHVSGFYSDSNTDYQIIPPAMRFHDVCLSLFPGIQFLGFGNLRGLRDSEAELLASTMCLMPKLSHFELSPLLFSKLTRRIPVPEVLSRIVSLDFTESVPRMYFNLSNQLALLASICPNLVELDLSYVEAVEWSERSIEWRIVDYSPLEQLPKLESVSLRFGRRFLSHLVNYELPKRLSIKKLVLRLYSDCADMCAVAKLFRACPRMASLAMYFYGFVNSNVNQTPCVFSDFLGAYETSNLRCLVLEDSTGLSKFQHLLSHALELASRAPLSLVNLRFRLPPPDQTSQNEHMSLIQNVISRARAHVLCLDVDLGNSGAVAGQLAFAMQYSALDSLVINQDRWPASAKPDPLAIRSVLPPGYLMEEEWCEDLETGSLKLNISGKKPNGHGTDKRFTITLFSTSK